MIRKIIFSFGLGLMMIVFGFLLHNIDMQSFLIQFIKNKLDVSLDEHFRSIGFSYLSTFLLFSGVVTFLYFLVLKNKFTEFHFYVASFCLLVFHYCCYLFVNARNYPVYDDQGAILEFLLNYSNTSTVNEKICLIIAPYNESIIIFPKLFVLGWLKIAGSINFRTLILFNGLLLLFLQLFLFAKMMTKETSRFLFFVLSLFIFQFQFYDDAFWATSGLCYYGSFIFTALAFYFLHRGKNFPALTFAIVSAFTFGNGWGSFFICIAFLLLEKRFRELMMWIPAFILVSIIFFMLRLDFHPLSTANWNLLDNILFILIFIGSAFQFFYSPVIPIIAGTFIISAFIFLAIKKQYKTYPVHFLLLAFIIFSAIAASPLRSGMEPNGLYGLHVRYGIFSILAFTLTVYLLSAYNGFEKKYKNYLIASAFIYNALTGIFFYPEAEIRREKIQSMMVGIKENKFDVGYSTFREDDVEILLKESIRKGIYKPH
ncbi:MAG: hypothetical protein ABI763_09680 [Bacteroidota bacterium]